MLGGARRDIFARNQPDVKKMSVTQPAGQEGGGGHRSLPMPSLASPTMLLSAERPPHPEGTGQTLSTESFAREASGDALCRILVPR